MLHTALFQVTCICTTAPVLSIRMQRLVPTGENKSTTPAHHLLLLTEPHADHPSSSSLTGTGLGLGWWLRWEVRREKRERHQARTPAPHLGPACMCSVAAGWSSEGPAPGHLASSGLRDTEGIWWVASPLLPHQRTFICLLSKIA